MRSKKYSLAEARANLPTIVDEAEAGVEIELTRHGKPVAVMISRQQFERLRADRLRFTDAYNVFLRKYSPKEIGLENDFIKSLRSPDVGRKVPL